MIFCTINDVKKPRMNRDLADVIPYDGNEFLYKILLQGTAMGYVFILIYLPISYIIETVYKKYNRSIRISICLLTMSSYSIFILSAQSIDF